MGSCSIHKNGGSREKQQGATPPNTIDAIPKAKKGHEEQIGRDSRKETRKT
jgi:hypothetical protein